MSPETIGHPSEYRSPSLSQRQSEYIGKTIWAERVRAIWNYSTQGISKVDLALQVIPARPAGAQDEKMNYTDRGYDLHAMGWTDQSRAVRDVSGLPDGPMPTV
jgi:hypothetical protein